MSEAGPPPPSYERPRRYEIPERLRPAPRTSDATVPGPPAERASAPTEPLERLERPTEAPPRRGPGPGGPQRPVESQRPGGPPRPSGPPGPGGAGPRGPGRPARPPAQGPGPASRRPDTKIILLAIGVVVVVVGAALGAYLALSGGDGNSSGPSDATATRQAADKVYTALNAHDETALKSLSCNPSGSVLGSIAGTLSSVREARPTSGERVSGHDATSAGTMLVSDSADPSARQTRVLFQLHLQKHGSRWCYAGLNPGTYAPAGPAPSSAASTASPTAAPSGTSACDAVVQVQVIAHLVSTPEPTSDAPESFVPPTVGRRLATCVSRFRATGHRAHVIVWTGALMQQYVSQLKQLQWQVIGASAAAPVLQNGLGVRVTVVHDGALLVMMLDEGH